VVFNDADKLLLEETFEDEDDQNLIETNRSVEINSFNRLYYDGLQQKLSR